MKANSNWAYPDTPVGTVSGTGNSRTCSVKRSASAASEGFAFNAYPSCTTPVPRDPDGVCAGLNAQDPPFVRTQSLGLTFCTQGVNVKGVASAANPGTNNAAVWGPFTCTDSGSSTCTGNQIAPPATTVCPMGDFPGVVNGISVCIPAQNSIAKGPAVTASAPAGAASAPPIEGGPAGATGSTSTTNCAAGSCNTTTTYTNGSGATVGTKDVSEPETTFCAKNPNDPVCKSKVDSSFSGACNGGFVAKGDALLSAVATATNKTLCALDPGPALDAIKGQLEAGIFGPALTNKDKSFASFNQSNPLSSGCPNDFTISTQLGSVVVPLSSMCSFLQALGYIALLVTLVYSTLFVVKGL